jgi:hypothetical protein
MMSTIHRWAIVGASAFAAFAFMSAINPGVSSAIECGYGTVFDPPSNTCVAAPAPAPPPPAPAWNGDITPYFSVGICAPIPFVSVCAGI